MQKAASSSQRLLSIYSSLRRRQLLVFTSQWQGPESRLERRQFSSKPHLREEPKQAHYESPRPTQAQIWKDLKKQKHEEFWADNNKPYRWAYLIIAAIVINVSVKAYRKKSAERDWHVVFSERKFVPFTIIARETVSPSSFILTLRPSDFITTPHRYKIDLYEKQWEQGIWSVEFKQPQLQIARSYTPLPPDENTKIGDLRFLIKKEKGGELSNYLAGLSAGAQVELRGPHPEFDIPEHTSDVLFLAGGTGIAPALQVAHTLLAAREAGQGSLHIHIVWANRKREDCLGGINSEQLKLLPNDVRPTAQMVQKLQSLQQRYPEHLKVEYLVDEEATLLDQKRLSALVRNTSEVKPTALTTRVDSRLLFVSGPEGFVKFLAGPKVWENGKEVQGEIGGILGRLGLRDWKVWKL